MEEAISPEGYRRPPLPLQMEVRRWLIGKLAGRCAVMVNVDYWGHIQHKGPTLLVQDSVGNVITSPSREWRHPDNPNGAPVYTERS